MVHDHVVPPHSSIRSHFFVPWAEQWARERGGEGGQGSLLFPCEILGKIL